MRTKGVGGLAGEQNDRVMPIAAERLDKMKLVSSALVDPNPLTGEAQPI
jgi:hypothetical protein